MAKVKISKIAKDLNVALSTVFEFLKRKNISVEEHPNARIEDDVAQLLIYEFRTDKSKKAVLELKKRERLLKYLKQLMTFAELMTLKDYGCNKPYIVPISNYDVVLVICDEIKRRWDRLMPIFSPQEVKLIEEYNGCIKFIENLPSRGGIGARRAKLYYGFYMSNNAREDVYLVSNQIQKEAIIAKVKKILIHPDLCIKEEAIQNFEAEWQLTGKTHFEIMPLLNDEFETSVNELKARSVTKTQTGEEFRIATESPGKPKILGTLQFDAKGKPIVARHTEKSCDSASAYGGRCGEIKKFSVVWTFVEDVKSDHVVLCVGETTGIMWKSELGKLDIGQLKKGEKIKAKVIDICDDRVLFSHDAIDRRIEITPGEKNTYVIDTNIFLECPDIIRKICEDYDVVIPEKVITEIDFNKTNKDAKIKENAKEAIRIIHDESKFGVRVRIEKFDSAFLPKDLDSRNNDDIILSVAIKIAKSSCHPILLTNDKGLSIKATAHDITSINLQDFLAQ